MFGGHTPLTRSVTAVVRAIVGGLAEAFPDCGAVRKLPAAICGARAKVLPAAAEAITDTGVLQLCRQRGRCATLRRVVLSENFSVGDAAIEALTLAAPNLVELEAEATGLSDVGLMALAKSRQLQLLNAGYCRGVSDFGVRQLTACSGLVALNLTACAVFDPHPLSFRRHCCFAMKTCGVINDTS